jgi:hypothetical protein
MSSLFGHRYSYPIMEPNFTLETKAEEVATVFSKEINNKNGIVVPPIRRY